MDRELILQQINKLTKSYGLYIVKTLNSAKNYHTYKMRYERAANYHYQWGNPLLTSFGKTQYQLETSRKRKFTIQHGEETLFFFSLFLGFISLFVIEMRLFLILNDVYL